MNSNSKRDYSDLTEREKEDEYARAINEWLERQIKSIENSPIKQQKKSK